MKIFGNEEAIEEPFPGRLRSGPRFRDRSLRSDEDNKLSGPAAAKMRTFMKR
jgi:hypothetical protein